MDFTGEALKRRAKLFTPDPYSDDPQADAIGQGQQPVVDAAVESLKQDYENRLTYPDIVAAMHGDPEMGHKVADNSLGFAMGSLGEVKGTKSVTKEALEKRASKTAAELPMDEASKLQRAKDMGFDTEKKYYHGTASGPFDEFHESNYPGIAAFVTPERKFAEKFANDPYYSRGLVQEGEEQPYVHELLVKAKKAFDYENPAHVAELVDSIPKRERADLIKGTDYKKLSDALASGNWAVLEKPEILDLIKSKGFDAAHVMEDGVKNLALFDRSQLRRPAAKFDPAKAKSGLLSAGVGGAAIGSGLLNQDQ